MTTDDRKVCYLDLAPTCPNENTIMHGGVVSYNVIDGYVFDTVDALLHNIADRAPGRLIVEWTVGRDESNPRAKNRLTSRRVVGRTVMVDGKIVVKP